MAAGDRIEHVIREIAARHGVGLTRDDPVLMLLTINEHLLAAGEEQQRKLLDAFKSELEAIAQRSGESARVQAEKALQAALETSREAMAAAAQQCAAATSTGLQALVQTHAHQTATHLRHVRQVALINLGGGLMTLVAALVLAWVAI